ncbi:MAG: hypothetical protein J1E80_07690 [Desulfovibrionaceae bacterium]|nr:hypothetical protein [Desulfovibrionaceae bacterium]
MNTAAHACDILPESIPGLRAPSDWVEPDLVVLDQGRPVSFHIADALRYHGLDSVGGVILGFRLAQRALAELSPYGPAERRELALFTSFPGYGVRDTLELVTRMVSEGRYTVDPSFVDERASEGVTGRCYFRFSLGGKLLELSPPPGVPGAEFVRWGRASKVPAPDASTGADIARRWKDAKFDLANLLLAADCRKALRVLTR